ncbi:MAG: hypothetical protein AAGH78_00790 [Cyanobacteria bacterium P01_H01_bin.58]
MQLNLLPIANSQIRWARRAYHNAGVVVCIRETFSSRAVTAIAPNCRVLAVQPLKPGWLALLLADADELLQAVAEPASHGSQTEGVLLPW